jgi:hypothetical protein
MLRKKEYRELAERINRRMAWRRCGWEMLMFYAVGLVVPPLAAFLMVSLSFNAFSPCVFSNVVIAHTYIFEQFYIL